MICFKHDNFEVRVEDQNNLELWAFEKVEIRERAEGERGKGRPTGSFEMQWVFKGYYSNFEGVLFAMGSLAVQKSGEITEALKKLDELKVIGRGIKLLRIDHRKEGVEEVSEVQA